MKFHSKYKKTKIKIVHKQLHLNNLKLRVFSLGLLALFICAIFISPIAVNARTFNPHNIIVDEELINKNSLSKTAIQKFLEREGSVLARYSQIVNGQVMSAAEMVWSVGQKHGVNPKFILTTL